MTAKGRIINVLAESSGITSQGKPWRKREFVLETEERYPKKICFSVMNDRIDQLNITVGQMYNVDFDLESREYQGKWYHSVTAYRATIATN